MEIRGMGILNITHLFGVAAVRDNKKIEVVVELSEVEEGDYDRLGTEGQVWPILGVDVPLVRIPLRPGRNIASLIEVVARNQLLKYRGHDSAREFQEKVDARIRATTLPGPHTPGHPLRAENAPEPIGPVGDRSGIIPISEVE
jgi:HPr kinase/phosphorylase